jgi:hypothetical protein
MSIFKNNENIFSYANELVNTLLEKEILSYDDIENLYLDDEPQEILEWYIVTEEAYNKFKLLDYPVIKFKELYLYGRTIYGQAILMDFYYISNEKLINFINNISKE